MFWQGSCFDMGFPGNVECNKIIDQIIESRRSIRKFKPEVPPKELIEKILRAGLHAPYAAASVNREDFRRFIVIPRENKATPQIAALLKREASSWSKKNGSSN
jgi:nitroreductase